MLNAYVNMMLFAEFYLGMANNQKAYFKLNAAT